MTETFAQSLVSGFLMPIISVLIFLIFIEVIMSWLVSFNVVNLRNPNVAQIYEIIRRVTNPILDPIRRLLPSMGGLDFSPIVAILVLSWVNRTLVGGMLYSALG